MTNELQILRNLRPVVAGPSPALHEDERRLLLAAIRPAPRVRHFTPRPVGALFAAAAALAALVFVISGSGSGGESAWAASVVKIAQTAPRLLIGADGWKVTDADQFGGDAGEVTFGSGTQQVELRWEPATDYPGGLADYTASADRVGTTVVLGAPAQIFRYRDTDLYTALWVADSHALELEGSAANVATFKSVLTTLKVVDVNTWLSALPSSVVLPGARNDVVRSLLADIPLPRGVDRSQFIGGQAVRDRYQLDAQVVAAVSCGWIEQWIAAKQIGSAPEVNEAVNAMGAVANSNVLRQMESGGAYPTVVRELSNAMVRGGNVVGPYAIGDQTVEETYRSSLGCSR